MHLKHEQEVNNNGANAVDLLSTETGISKQRIKLAMKHGAVWIRRGKRKTSRLRRATRPLNAGDKLFLYYDEKLLKAEPPEAKLVADLKTYSVWDKPAGMLSQGSKWGDHFSLARWAETRLDRNTFIVHRLDREASGLVLLAHTPKAAAALSRLFQEREIDKHYRVTVEGEFPEDQQRFDAAIDARPALSLAERLSFDAASNTSVLSVKIETGRKHQIRRHLADAGFPVVGDYRYGDKTQTGTLKLRAVELLFECPLTGKPQKFSLDNED